MFCLSKAFFNDLKHVEATNQKKKRFFFKNVKMPPGARISSYQYYLKTFLPVYIKVDLPILTAALSVVFK